MTCPEFERITPKLPRQSPLHWGEQSKVRRHEGLVMTHHLLRLLWCPMCEWVRSSCCDLLDWYNQIHPLPTSFRGASYVHTSMQVLPVLRGLQNSGDRMTKVNKDMKRQVHSTYTQSSVFLTPSSYWNWSGAHLIFHSDCCWQKTQGASSRYLSDNPLSGEGRLVWGWRAHERGIDVEHRYPDISGRCL